MLNRIGIIGDVHAEHLHLGAVLEFLSREQVDGVVCTGDLADGTGDINTCVSLLKDHDVLTVRGNHDRWVLENKARHVPHAHLLDSLERSTIEFLNALPPELNVDTPLGTLMLCHGVGSRDLQKIWPGTLKMPAERSVALDKIIAQGKYRFMINGHLHYRTLIHFEAFTLLNAGTLRGDHHPGFSILNVAENNVTGFELLPTIHAVKTHSLRPNAATQVFKNTQHFDDCWEPVTLYA